MQAELRDEGWGVNHKRVARLMKLEGLEGASRRRKWRTTKRAKDVRPAPDLVDRDFHVTGPDRLWVADVTYVPTSSGFPLPGRGGRCLEPPGGGLVDGDASEDGAGAAAPLDRVYDPSTYSFRRCPDSGVLHLTNRGHTMRIARQLFQKLPPLLALAVSVSLFVPGSVYGQTSLSLQAGASLATLGGSDVESADSRIGMRVGASAIFPFSANLDLQFGAAYTGKGATEHEAGIDLLLELDYLEIPVLLRFTPSVAGTLSPHFTIGPALSLRVGCSASAGAEGFEISVDCDDERDLKKIDFGAMAGAGIDIATSGSLSVSLDLLYNFGLSSISEADVKNPRVFDSSGRHVPHRLATELGLEVAPNGGHLFSLEKGVHDAKNETIVSTGVPATDGRAGEGRSYA